MISVSSLEVHAAYHCNLSCDGCMHLSPLEPPKFLSAESLEADLSALRGTVRAEVIRLLGGEPLLHPELDKLADIACRSGVAETVSISTNGLLLSKWEMCAELWQKVGECEVSIYGYSDGQIEKILSCCSRISARCDVRFHIYYCDRFRRPGTVTAISDQAMVHRVYSTCLIAREWQCFNVFEGRFYMCPQAMAYCRHIPDLEPEANSVPLLPVESLEERLRTYLSQTEPIPACSHCYGSCGLCLPHRQASRNQLMKGLEQASYREELDTDFLAELERSIKGYISLNTIFETQIIEHGMIRCI